MWRPKEGWDNPFKSVSEGGHLESPTGASIFEAGADAMLEALRKGATRVNNMGDPPQGKGVIVFIPDD